MILIICSYNYVFYVATSVFVYNQYNKAVVLIFNLKLAIIIMPFMVPFCRIQWIMCWLGLISVAGSSPYMESEHRLWISVRTTEHVSIPTYDNGSTRDHT